MKRIIIQSQFLIVHYAGYAIETSKIRTFGKDRGYRSIWGEAGRTRLRRTPVEARKEAKREIDAEVKARLASEAK